MHLIKFLRNTTTFTLLAEGPGASAIRTADGGATVAGVDIRDLSPRLARDIGLHVEPGARTPYLPTVF